MGTERIGAIQNSFNAGEISPLLKSRLDLERYKNSAEEIRNFIVHPQGPATYRSGLRYIATAKPTINPVWTALDPGNGAWTALAWSPELRLLVLLPRTATGTRSVLTSEDGITYTENISLVTETAVWESCVWAKEIGLYVAVASTSNVNGFRIITSPDGKTWFEQTQSVSKAWRSICWSPSLRLLVAVTDDTANTSQIMTSPDAVTWTTRTSPEASAWRGVIWVEELTLYVAVAETGTFRVMTSPDGITWTGRTAASANNWQSVAWSSSLTRLIAVANTGTDRVMRSSNGIAWTAVVDTVVSITRSGTTATVTVTAHGYKTGMYITISGADQADYNGTFQITVVTADTFTYTVGGSPATPATGTIICSPATANWEKIIWADEMGLFWAVASGGSNRIMYSATGLSGSWINIAEPATLNWEDIVYSAELDMLVGTASNATGNTVMYYGGTVAEAAKVRLLPFKFSTVQAYILELGHLYMRFYRNGAIITQLSQQISGITKANPAVVTYTGANNFANGDRFIIRDVLGMTEVNEREFEVANVNTGAKTFELYGVNSTAYTTYTSGGNILEIVELATTYVRDDLFAIKICQSADIVYLWNRKYQPRKLARSSHVAWTLTAITFKAIPTAELDFDMKISKTVASITRVATTATATVTAHGFLTGMYVTMSGANETQYNGTFLITVVDANTFTYTMASDPGASATGTLTCSSTTLKPLSITGNKSIFVAGDSVFFDGDVERVIKHNVSRGTIKEVHPISINSNIKTGGAITRSGNTATATFTAHGFSTGNNVTILGVTDNKYNGTFKITVVDANIFTYTVTGKPNTPATTTTDILCYLSPSAINITSIARATTEATVTTGAAHGFSNGDIVKIQGANEGKFNGTFEIFDVASTTFIFTVTDEGDASASGTMYCTKIAPTNIVSVDITDNFESTAVIGAGSWYLIGAPQAAITFSIKKPVGAVVKVTADKKAFRSADVGSHIKFPSSDSGTFPDIEIKSYVNNKEIQGKIIQALHKDDEKTIDAGEWTLEQPAWSASLGWPSVGVFFEDRLWVARDDTFWGSEVGDYENFTIGKRDDSALSFTLGSRQINPIRWIEPKDGLIMGTTGDIWKVSGGSGEPITPSNIIVKKISIGGSSDAIAVDTPSALLYINRLEKEIGEIVYNIEEDGLVANEITIWAEHLFKYGIKEIIYQEKPVPIIWAILNSGELCGCTYLRRQAVLGWFKMASPFGFFESGAVIPGSKHDEFWVSVLRQINGTNVRHIEKFAPVYGTELDDWISDHIQTFVDDADATAYAKGYYVPYDLVDVYTNTKGENAFLLDAGITQDIVTATATISNLWHLNGMSVYAVVDGVVKGPHTVSNGKITLAAATAANAVVHVGLVYDGVLKIARFDAIFDNGTTKGLIRRVISITAQIYGSGLFKFGDSTTNLKVAKFLQSDTPTHVLFTGDSIDSAFPGRHGRQADIVIVQDQPLPLIVQSITQKLEAGT